MEQSTLCELVNDTFKELSSFISEFNASDVKVLSNSGSLKQNYGLFGKPDLSKHGILGAIHIEKDFSKEELESLEVSNLLLDKVNDGDTTTISILVNIITPVTGPQVIKVTDINSKEFINSIKEIKYWYSIGYIKDSDKLSTKVGEGYCKSSSDLETEIRDLMRTI